MMQRIRQRWIGLSGRERTIVTVLGLTVAVALLMTQVVDPLLERLDLLDRQLAVKQRTINQLEVLGGEYLTARAQVAEFDQRIAAGKGTFSLLSYLEESASAVQIREQIAAMQPQTSASIQGYREITAELRLDGVPFSSLLMLIAKLEGSPYLVQVRRLQITPKLDAPHRFDARLTVATYEKE